jgi:hypothetical protein
MGRGETCWARQKAVVLAASDRPYFRSSDEKKAAAVTLADLISSAESAPPRESRIP